MRVLILSCNTGGGHNACADAIQEAMVQNGHFCQTADALRFVSDKLSKFLGWGHTTMYRRVPKLFCRGYSFAEKHPAVLSEDAAAYKLLTDGTKRLHDHIQSGNFDAVICPHVFSGLLLRQTLKEYPMKLMTAFVATDYTCSPGTGVSELDLYFIPDDSLWDEYVHQLIPASRVITSGIPVRKAFYTKTDQDCAKRSLKIDPAHTHLLMMCGSMGCGPMEKLVKLLSERMTDTMELSVICGTNEKLKKELQEHYAPCPNIHIHGFVQDVGVMMDSADLYLTKPGGLSSTEAAVKKLPMVLIDAVAGCEAYNRDFFVSLGGAVTADTPEELVSLCIKLMEDPAKRAAMAKALDCAVSGNAAQRICDAMKQRMP